MNNAVFEKIIENLRKYRDIQLVKNEARSNYLESETNNHTEKMFWETLLATEMKKKTQLHITKPIYSGLSILEIMYDLWYGYAKPKYREKGKSCYRDTNSFTVYIKTEDIYVDIAKDLKKYLIFQVMNLTDH